MICQTLWNYSEKITSATSCFGEDETEDLQQLLLEYLGKPCIFMDCVMSLNLLLIFSTSSLKHLLCLYLYTLDLQLIFTAFFFNTSNPFWFFNWFLLLSSYLCRIFFFFLLISVSSSSFFLSLSQLLLSSYLCIIFFLLTSVSSSSSFFLSLCHLLLLSSYLCLFFFCSDSSCWSPWIFVLFI